MLDAVSSDKLMDLLREKESYRKLNSYVSQTQMRSSINKIIDRIDRKINKIARNIKR